jgi:hypothetical protein
MSAQNRSPDYGLLRPTQGSKAEPQFVHDPYPRVIDWGMPEDVHAGDFTFAVLEAALAARASEIQLTSIKACGKISGDFCHHFFGMWIATLNRDCFLNYRDETHFGCSGCYVD